MTTNQHLVLTTIVARAEWQADRHGVLDAAYTALADTLRQRGLLAGGEARETVEILPHTTRVRVTLTVDGVPLGGVPQPAAEPVEALHP